MVADVAAAATVDASVLPALRWFCIYLYELWGWWDEGDVLGWKNVGEDGGHVRFYLDIVETLSINL